MGSIIEERGRPDQVKMPRYHQWMVQTAPVEWERPSDRVREYFRNGAQIILNSHAEWLEALHDAELSAANMQELADDPVLNTALRRTTAPTCCTGPRPMCGIPERRWRPTSVLNRSASPAIWCAAALTNRPCRPTGSARTLHGSDGWRSRSVSPRTRTNCANCSTCRRDRCSAFVDATLAGIAEQMQIERDELVRGTHAERREAVALILDGAPISRQRAETRLGYNLEQTHTAAVVWGDEPDCDSSQLDRATEALVHGANVQRALSVIASAATRWVWIPGNVAPDLRRLEEVIIGLPGFASRLDRPPAASRGSGGATSTRSPRNACWRG